MLIEMSTYNCRGGRLVAGVSGQLSYAQLWNPLGSHRVATVTSFRFAPGANTFIDFRYQTSAVGSPVVSLTSEIIGSDYVAQLQLNVGNQVSAPGNLMSILSSTSNSIQEALTASSILLQPGFGISLNPLSPNVSIGVTLSWIERVI